MSLKTRLFDYNKTIFDIAKRQGKLYISDFIQKTKKLWTLWELDI